MRLAPFVVMAAALASAAAAQAPSQRVLFPGLEGQSLLDAVRAAYRPPFTLGYDVARDSLFAWEQRRYGSLTCVYTGFAVVLQPGADPSTSAFNQGVNTEHTWPQSMGASAEPSRSDMHHLYPTRADVNSSRGNVPYGEVPDAQTDRWYRLAAAQTTVPLAFLDEWSEKDNATTAGFQGRFEPREAHSGNAARAVFYYRAVYPDRVAAAGSEPFFRAQVVDLLAWARQDPVDGAEMARMEWVADKQQTENPFVLDSTLARRAYAPGTTAAETGVPPGTLTLRVVGPNPFRGTTTVVLAVASPGWAVVEAFDVVGRRVAVLHDGPLAAGPHALAFGGSALAPGVYVVRAATAAGTSARRVTVAR